MKKIILIILMMFSSINLVFASDKIMIDVISVSEDSVTLEIKVDNVIDDVCYLYKSIDGINYDNQMIIDCNKMYVDKSLDSGITYYKAKYGNDDNYSDVIKVNSSFAEKESLKLTRNINELSFNGLGFMAVFGLAMIILVTWMCLFRKKAN